MKQISNIADALLSTRPLQEDEYLNETDGLIYCAKCHTPRQHPVQLNDRVMLPTVRCRCQQEQDEKETAERKRQEFLMEVSRLKANGLQDKSLRDYTFANVEVLIESWDYSSSYTVALDAADSITFEVPDYPAHYTITASFQGSNGVYNVTFAFNIGDADSI